MNTYTIAFVGNPNVGKSAWINALSDADFKIGNWPGVTVEKKEAYVTWGEDGYHLIDLPGTYSLEESGNEEAITAQYLKNEHVDLIVNIVDATNLARNLLLTLLLRELQIPMIVIFNFMDEVEKYHIHIQLEKFARRLQTPILPYSAYDSKNYEKVKVAIQQNIHMDGFYYPLLPNQDIEIYVQIYTYIEQRVPVHEAIHEQVLQRITMGVCKGDVASLKQVAVWGIELGGLDAQRKQLTKDSILQHQYDVIESLMKYVIQDEDARYAHSKRIDSVLLHRYFGMPLFFLIFTFLLLFVFQFSAPWNAFIEFLIHDIAKTYIAVAIAWMPASIQSLLLNGVIAGVGGVLTFVPLMGVLYMVLSLLEESGYMARIAFLLDRMMGTFHLSGKSFVSLLLGFGCNVPAIYATRTLDNEKQKRLTALLIPFMSCGARLPVYVLFAAAFFPIKAAVMILSVYGIGIFFALLLALVYSHTTSFKDHSVFVLELPPYRLPAMNVVMHKAYLEIKSYVKKATGIVLWAMIVLWGLSYFPNETIQDSYIAQGAKVVQPLFEPLGFGDRWECIASLPGGIIAKETVIGFLDQVVTHSQPVAPREIAFEEDIKQIAHKFGTTIKSSVMSVVRPNVNLKADSTSQVSAIRGLWSDKYAQIRAFSFMVYVLLSIPCIMTLQAMYHEYGVKLVSLSIASMLIIPYVVSFLIFQVFSFFM